jgi:tetratricopeptide (TPR) repeat protein
MFALSVSVLALFPRPAAAQDDKTEQARGCYERGQRLYDLGRYQDAIDEFEKGYLLSGLPAFLINIAQAYRLAGDEPRAIDYYKRFLLKADADDPARAGAEKVLAELTAPKPPPGSLAPPTPAYDGGLTQDEIKATLGPDYSRYVASGLTFEAYTRRKKALRWTWIGGSVAAGGYLGGSILLGSSGSDVGEGGRALGATLILAGTVGGTVAYVGWALAQSMNAQKRQPAAVTIGLGPSGAGLSVRF